MNMKQIGRYTIKGMIGQGGTATIYLAFDPNIKRDVAIKVLPPSFTHDPMFRERFEREVQIIAAVEYPGIVPVYDFGEQDGYPYIVMRMMSGGSLSDKLRSAPLSLEQTARIITQIAAALDYAHSKGFVHRDIKPGNILFDSDGSAYLADFGLGKLLEHDSLLTGEGMIGTPSYMSPEQARGETGIDGRSDIYSLGAVLFEMLTGCLPYTASTPMGVAIKHITGSVPNISDVAPGFPSDHTLQSIIARSMAKDKAARFATAGEMAQALADVVKAGVPEIRVSKIEPPHHFVPEEALESREHVTQILVQPPIINFPTILPAKEKHKKDCLFKRLIRKVRQTIRLSKANLAERTNRTFIVLHKAANDIKSIVSEPQILSQPQLTQTHHPPRFVGSEHRAEIPPMPDPLHRSKNPSLVMRPYITQLLNPHQQTIIEEVLSQHEPEQLINYILTQQSGQFIITGYNHFGGTTLLRSMLHEICEKMPEQNASDQTLVVRFDLDEHFDKNEIVYQATFSTSQGELFQESFALNAEQTEKVKYTLLEVFDFAFELLVNGERKSRVWKMFEYQGKLRTIPAHLLIGVDKITTLDTLKAITRHPVFGKSGQVLLLVIERELLNQWKDHNQFDPYKHFQLWHVPCLWEGDSHLVQDTLDFIFHGYNLEDSEIHRLVEDFHQHIVFVGRGATGNIFGEIRKVQYWQIEPRTKMAYIELKGLDRDLIEHNAWMQRTLDKHWKDVLGKNFHGREAIDRARQGVYTLVDWIIDHATFTLDEVLDAAAKTHVLISPHSRTRDEVVLRLLATLVQECYLQRAESGYDIIWRREINPETTGLIQRNEQAEHHRALREQFTKRQKNLEKLYMRRSSYGEGEVPLSLLNDIETEEIALSGLQALLSRLESKTAGEDQN
jgi:serine/threonine protein kinase